MGKFKIKVCGLKYSCNCRDVEKLPVDLLGFIFYPGSKRYAGASAENDLFKRSKPKVAVFVDEVPDLINDIAGRFRFEYVQLHGKENPATCNYFMQQGFKMIKAFNIDSNFDFKELDEYEGKVNYFLFDTKTDLPGGSGEKFNWELLGRYTGSTPFFLSGGIGSGDAAEIKKLRHPQFSGLDLNSGFEEKPGLKSIDKLRIFLAEIAGEF